MKPTNISHETGLMFPVKRARIKMKDIKEEYWGNAVVELQFLAMLVICVRPKGPHKKRVLSDLCQANLVYKNGLIVAVTCMHVFTYS